MNTNPILQEFISKRNGLFWSVVPEKRNQISEQLTVETILNYGNLEDVKGLFEILGLENVANIFSNSIYNRTRHNYFPEVVNFFKLYFKRHAPKYFS